MVELARELDCGIYRLAKGNTTWEQKFTTDYAMEKGFLEIDPLGAIYAMVIKPEAGHIFRSDRDGLNWSDITKPDRPSYAMTMCTGGHIFACASDSIIITADNGSSWGTPMCGPGIDAAFFHLTPSGDIYAAAADFGGMVTSTGHVFCCRNELPGDYNLDEYCNIADVVGIIGLIFKGGAFPSCQTCADANGDGAIGVGDAVCLINYIFKSGPPPHDYR